MFPKNVSATYAKRLILLVLLMASGCAVFSRPPPPVKNACAAKAMAKCDTTDPETPATAAEMSADFALDLAAFFKAQRNECSALNEAKTECITNTKGKK